MRGWIAVDLDSTLAVYPHSFPGIGPPIAPMVTRVKALLAEGYEVRIFTARVAESGLSNGEQVDNADFVTEQRALIDAWSEEHIGQRLVATATKDFQMICQFDDRAVQVEANTGRLVGPGIIIDGVAVT